MNDDRAPEPLPESGDAQPDPDVVAALAVAPLDDLTRRRLVRAALDQAPPIASPIPRPAARLVTVVGIAAALLVGTVVGTIVVTRPDDPERTTAARAPAVAAAPLATESATRLGDLGNVASPEALRAAIAGRLEAGDGTAFDTSSALPCVDGSAAAAGLVVLGALGTATLGGSTPVVVLVGPTPAGKSVAVALDASSCAVLETVSL